MSQLNSDFNSCQFRFPLLPQVCRAIALLLCGLNHVWMIIHKPHYFTLQASQNRYHRRRRRRRWPQPPPRRRRCRWRRRLRRPRARRRSIARATRRWVTWFSSGRPSFVDISLYRVTCQDDYYRVTRQLESCIMLQSIWGVPLACGPLLQLATAQAGQGNSPNWLQHNIGLKLTGHPVHNIR